ncbi:hypothetical protein HYW42_02125 [Candidatus Daviesbacteria bacterium]|nr:hypothetical protein [Candidatus Daviesbacteria bacterium]
MRNITKAFRRYKEILIITLSIRTLLFIFSTFVGTEQHTSLLNLWLRWDAPHYLDLARNWYQPTGEQSLWIVFYPLYPLFIKFTNILLGNFELSSLLVSTLFSVFASILLFELSLLDFNKSTSLKAVWFMNIFPTSYFLQAPYTESLFLTLSITSIYLIRKDNYLYAGATGLLASLTRINGLLLIPSLFIEAKTILGKITAVFLTTLGFIFYLMINYFIFGDLFYFTKPLSYNWFKHLDWPWVGVYNLLNTFSFVSQANFYIYLSEIISILIVTIFTIASFLYLRKSYSVYMLINLFLFTSTNFILSVPRYSLILFPIFILLGLIKKRLFFVLISITSLTLLVYLTFLYVSGRWAF